MESPEDRQPKRSETQRSGRRMTLLRTPRRWVTLLERKPRIVVNSSKPVAERSMPT
jgi:hypothetical protein